MLHVEPDDLFETLDVTSNIDTDFPSDEFGDFIKLVVKWNLSDACSSEILRFSQKICRDNVLLPTSTKQGRQFLDQISAPHISFEKVPIINYKDEIYYLYYRSIFNAIKELLGNKDILKTCVFSFSPVYHENQRIYSEQYESEWWERAQRSIPSNAKVLSIILYSDATICDHIGKSSEHPVYLTLGNIPNWRRNRPDAKVLLGYLPSLKAQTISQKRSSSFRAAKQHLYQYAFDILTRPLLNYQNNGFDLQTNNNVLWCYPFISIMLGDLPENAALTLTFNSVNCKHPCHTCLVPADNLNNTALNNNQIILRTPEMMKNAIGAGFAQQYSLHHMENIFWKYW